MSVSLLLAAAITAAAPAPPGALPKGVVSVPTPQQVMAAYPPAARAAKLSGWAELSCLVFSGDDQIGFCTEVSESAEGLDFAKWARRLAYARLVVAPTADPDLDRKIRIRVEWDLTAATPQAQARFTVGKLEAAQAPDIAPIATITPRPPGWAPAKPEPPVDDRITTVGACAWTTIGPEGRAELRGEAGRTYPRFDAIIEYHADWSAALERCDPGLLGKHRDTILSAIGAYAGRQVYLELLGPYGLDAQKIDAAAAGAPVASKAAMYYGVVDRLDQPAAIWGPVFTPLKLAATPQWKPGSPQALVISYLRYTRRYQHEVSVLDTKSPDYDAGLSISMTFGGPRFSIPVAKPILRQQPTPDQMAKAYPTLALIKNISATVVMDCIATAEGRMETCTYISGGPSYSDGYDFNEWNPIELVERTYAVEPLDAGGNPVGGRTIHIVLKWQGNPPYAAN